MNKPKNKLQKLFQFAVLFLLCAPSVRAQSGSEDSKFLRFVPNGDNAGTLEASVVRYRNADGVTVDLVAAVHIAEPSFFKSIDDSFTQYDAVLYEMVKPKSMIKPSTNPNKPAAPTTPATQSAPRAPSMRMIGGLQKMMRDMLKLEYQLDGIDYDRPNFVHADLDAETFLQMQDDRGESLFTIMMRAMMTGMKDPSIGANSPGVLDLIRAMQSPDKSRQLKLLLGRQFSSIDKQMSLLEGPKGSVILTERNKVAMNKLKETIGEGKKTLAVFYGAAHLKGMEKIMIEEMGFTQVGDPQWIVAWDMQPLPATKPSGK